MAIEFRCRNCNRLLRTGDDTAGKHAQCPECGAITVIPAASTAVTEAPGPPLPIPPAGGAPLGSIGDQRGQPTDSGISLGPSALEETQLANYAAARVAAPAMALITVTVLGIAVQVSIFYQLARFGVEPLIPEPFKEAMKDIPVEFTMTVFLIVGSLELALSLVTLVGAMKMRRLEKHTLAVIGALLALIPCTSPCCPLPLPFAIWALVVLNDRWVKAAFRRKKSVVDPFAV